MLHSIKESLLTNAFIFLLQSTFSALVHCIYLSFLGHKRLVQQTMNLDEKLKDRQQQIVSVDRAGAALKMNFCCGLRKVPNFVTFELGTRVAKVVTVHDDLLTQ